MTARVLVVGGGPAGMSAALWLKHLGLTPHLVEREGGLGGMQRRSNYANPFLLGFVGRTGAQIAAAFAEHMAAEEISVHTLPLGVAHLEAHADHVSATLHANSAPQAFAACVLAMGTRFRELHVPGERVAETKGWLRSLGDASDVLEARGQNVAVFGGGDNAASVALELAPIARRVTVLARSPLRAQRQFLERLRACDNVEIRTGWSVTRIDAPRIHCTSSGQSHVEEYDRAYCTIGFVPNTEPLRTWFPTMALDAQGYVRIDGNARTSVPLVWAAGDLCNPVHPCTATAVALGTMAARDIELQLRERA